MTAMQESQRKLRKPKAKSKEGFTCGFCNKTFMKESTYLVHLCERKRRWIDRDTKHAKVGFMVFQKFYEVSYGAARKPKTVDEFIKSNLYTAFMSFGRYIVNNNVINPSDFIMFVIKSGVPLKNWESPVLYEKYVRELNKKETPYAAVERHFLLVKQWSIDTGEEMYDFFRKISPAQATMWIQTGRISPWVLFNCESANDMIGRLSEEQLDLIYSYIDPEFWKIKFKMNEGDANIVREELKAFGM